MLNLRFNLDSKWDGQPFVARLTNLANLPRPLRSRHILLHTGISGSRPPEGFRAHFGCGPAFEERSYSGPIVALPKEASYLASGDVVSVNPQAGSVSVVFRQSSRHNTFLLTERCNSHCVMCAQPPKDRADSHLVHALLDAIPLIGQETEELGLSGGEPTLLGEELVKVVRTIRSFLPRTRIHMLTNARLLRYVSFARELSKAARGHGLVLGIPLNSDLADEHDMIVGCQGAWDETIKGILNAHRFGLPVELRLVLHRKSVKRLKEYSRFVIDNFPFVNHVAFMGLEVVGLARSRESELWIDPHEYVVDLEAAADALDRFGLAVSLYNIQLCLLSDVGRTFARKSISDWKAGFLEICEPCTLRNGCCGFFETDGMQHSAYVQPVIAR